MSVQMQGHKSAEQPLSSAVHTSFDDETLVRWMLKIYRHFSATAARRYAEQGYSGLGFIHTNLVSYLDPEGTRIVTLAARIGSTKQFAGRLVQELAQQGLVETQPDPSDKRAVLVRLTEAGQRYFVFACQVKDDIEGQYEKLIGAELLGAFVEGMRKLATDLPEHSAPTETE